MAETDPYDKSAIWMQDLDYSENDIYFHEGFPFTGVAFDEDEDGRAELSFLEGVQEGPMREWYPDGSIKIEAAFHRGVAHGEWRSYAQDGSLQEVRTHEFGMRISVLTYGPTGEPVETFRIVEGSPNHQVLLGFRARYGAS